MSGAQRVQRGKGLSGSARTGDDGLEKRSRLGPCAVAVQGHGEAELHSGAQVSGGLCAQGAGAGRGGLGEIALLVEILGEKKGGIGEAGMVGEIFEE